MTKKTNSAPSHLFSREGEQMVLGCMLNSNESLCSAFEKEHLMPSQFYYAEHSTIFLAMESLFKSTRKSDVHLLSEELKRRGRLDTVGGVEYLISLASIAGTSAYFEAYAQDLKSLSRRREFVKHCEELHKEALSSDLDPTALATLASEKFAHMAKKGDSGSTLQIAEVSRGERSEESFLDSLKEKVRVCTREGRSLLPGLSTGYPSLDGILGGFREENFILVAARPSVGKTAFALNLVRNLGVFQKVPVAFYSI